MKYRIINHLVRVANTLNRRGYGSYTDGYDGYYEGGIVSFGPILFTHISCLVATHEVVSISAGPFRVVAGR